MEKQYRFPGPRTFNSDESIIFFGRDVDIAQICTSIAVNATTVLFGNSGTGKSSLIQAGVLKKLQQREFPDDTEEGESEVERIEPYLPINVTPKPYDKTDTLQNKILSIIKRILDPNNTFPQLFQSTIQPSVWYLLKQFQYTRFLNQQNQTLLLIFDQAEELFTYPDSQIKGLVQELCPVIGQFVPQHFQQLISEERSLLNPDVKILLRSLLPVRTLFSLRSDRLHLITRLKKASPHILLNSYELLPLRENEALECMGNPPQAAGENFITEKFEITDEAKKHIFQTLALRITDPENNFDEPRIEPFGLQIICSYIEQQILPGDEDRKIQKSEVGDPNKIINEYYLDCISKLVVTEETKENVRKLIEEKMLIDGRRIPLHQATIENDPGCVVSFDALKELVKAKILKIDYDAYGKSIYEITHDFLIAPILQTKVERQTKIGTEAISATIKELTLKIKEKLNPHSPKEIVAAEKPVEELEPTHGTMPEKKDVDATTLRYVSGFGTKAKSEKFKQAQPEKLTVKVEKEESRELYDLYKRLSEAYLAVKNKEKAVNILEEATRRKSLSSRRALLFKDIGNIYLDEGESKIAKSYYQKAIKNNPLFTDAIYNMGVAEERLNNPDAALKYYKRVIEIHPDDIDAYSNIAALNVNRGNNNEARHIYQKLIKAYPNNESNYFNLGVIEEIAQHWDLALTYYKKVVEINPYDIEALNKVGEIYFNKGDYQNAKLICEQLIARNPQDEWNYYNMGLIEETLENWDAALKNYEIATSIEPDYEQALDRIAEIHFNNKNYAAAKAVFEKLLKMNPTNTNNPFNIALIEETVGNTDAALDMYEKILRTNPKDKEVLTNIGRIYFDQKRYQKARGIAQKIIVLAPKDEYNYINLGLIEEALENWKLAMVNYKKAIKIAPGNAEAYYNLAFVDKKLNNNESAIRNLEKAVQLQPTNPNFHANLGDLYDDSGKTKEAIREFRLAIKYDPNTAQHYTLLGYSLSRLGKDKRYLHKAIEEYQKSLKLDPEDGYTSAALAACFKKLGKDSEYNKQVKLVKKMRISDDEYVQASIAALCSYKAEAIRLLRIALKKKLRTIRFIKNDPDFDFIRNEPEFKALVKDKVLLQ